MIATCSWCGTDEHVEDQDTANDVAFCVGPGHPEPRMFEPKKEWALAQAKTKSVVSRPEGIAAELGLYEDLLALLQVGEWADTVVVEYRYALEYPDTYAWMLDRWGHIQQGTRRYSTSAFIGSTLGQLSREARVAYKSGPGSGFTSRNSSIGFWALTPVPDEAIDMGWKRFAGENDLDPEIWPFV